ncbi:MAG: carboxymuconolactone decarboxylase family protein [Rhizobiaceae bacterium]
MATVKLIRDEEASAEVLAVFDDIRAVRKTNFINNFWRGLANDPQQLKAIWEEIKTVMAPGAIDPLTKEMIYIAVSVANSCTYCTHSHTAAARAKGMSQQQHNELMRVIALAGKTNHAVNAMQLDTDDDFKADK